MLFKTHVLDGLANGTIDLAFRAWRRASVHDGSTFRSPIGVLRVESIDRVAASGIGDGDARRAGFPSARALLKDLKVDGDAFVFRIGLSVVGPDERIALREKVVDSDEVTTIRSRLDRLDRASRGGPWTSETLRLIHTHPAVRASALALQQKLDTPVFKRRVRQLKELGLTESLGTGYRISPRGESYLVSIDGIEAADSGSPKPVA